MSHLWPAFLTLSLPNSPWRASWDYVPKKVQLTFKQHGSTCKWFFFGNCLYCSWSVVGNLWVQGRLYALSHSIFYKELEHPWSLVSMGVLDQSPADTEGQLNFGGIKSYMWIFDCAGVARLPPLLLKGQLYLRGNLALSVLGEHKTRHYLQFHICLLLSEIFWRQYNYYKTTRHRVVLLRKGMCNRYTKKLALKIAFVAYN